MLDDIIVQFTIYTGGKRWPGLKLHHIYIGSRDTTHSLYNNITCKLNIIYYTC
jgi:hypothetical protein